MFAYVMSAPGVVTRERLSDPVCGPDEVVLRTEAVSVCSTDISYYRGHLIPESWPVVPGHEYVGQVVEVGARLRGTVTVGERLTYWGQTDFGGLAEFRALRPLFPSDGPERESTWHTERNFYDAAQAAVAVVPPDVPGALATLAEPLTSVLRSLLINPPRPGDTVVLLGCGPSALLALQILTRCMGAGHVVAVDHNPDRLEAALRLGATETFDPAHQADALEAFVARHQDHFADYVFDALPHVELDAHGYDVREMAMRLLRPAGDYVVYGATARPQTLKTWLILAKGLKVQAAPFDVRMFPMRRTAHVLRTALGYLQGGVVDVKPLVTGTVGFHDEDGVRAVFERYGTAASLKTSIAFPPSRTGEGAHVTADHVA
ncbi:zinc-binding dehydrogenase [Streptomyces sp. A1136]|uniref:zinc-dependent alcohol dehydrogenase n=1 Tax=Streptomyces sp. A1136 TaxID=2563102 RepID=UPI00109E62D5|nr:zinc-binding dehydrogenase [Streptomyces sp. A1136]THA48324.1 alcohol dehydrogenase [Streptomyces sp. A1136]